LRLGDKLTIISLLGRGWPSLALDELASPEAIDELTRVGALTTESQRVHVTEAYAAHATELSAAADASARALAATLLARETDPWARMHAALLSLEVNPTEASTLHCAAVRSIAAAGARRAALASWRERIATLDAPVRTPLALEAADVAVELGEHAEALRVLRIADAAADARSHLLWGRAYLGTGDLTAADAALAKAERLTSAESSLWDVRVEQGELAYMLGEFESVRTRFASLESAPPRHRIRARNVLGKVLLAEARWSEADRHFAEDVMEAAAAGDLRSELRARLNRGIAMLSVGRLSDARAVFAEILTEAEGKNEPLAEMYALTNLAVVAVRQHRYGEALSLWERTSRMQLTAQHVDGGVRVLTNLAALRLRLGLVGHAEHALAFARRLLDGRGTAWLRAKIRVEEASIALVRKQTLTARQLVESALSEIASAGSSDKMAEAYNLSVRIALEDGDVQRANADLSTAESFRCDGFERATIAVLRARVARAEGLSAEAFELARGAHDAVQPLGDEELLRELHVLQAHLAKDVGDLDAARLHVSRALALRDQVAASLDGEVRAAYLSKAEVVELARLQSVVDGDEAPRTERSPRGSTPPPPMAASKEIIGEDHQIQTLRAAIRKVARTSATVLVRGESGTGKELVAAALHAESDRANGPFVALNCAALAETLLLSELFGHEKGAFTGAASRKRGRFEVAEGGTLFLDEIGDISAKTQVALLRILQEKTFERVGGTTSIRANVRVICATHRDLRAMVERGEFREDLYYRLRQVALEVPALRGRMGDLPRIAEALLRRVAMERAEVPKTFTADGLELLGRYKWPGNIRELENVIRAVTLFAETSQIGAADLVANVEELAELAQQTQSSVFSQAPALRLVEPTESVAALPEVTFDENAPLPEVESGATQVAYSQIRQGVVSLHDMKRQIERDCIARALAETSGNITKAAALLGMKRPRLSQLVKQYGLAVSSEGSS
jgi:DNA-binding NtrC family response regulator/tetratricopeptide (TPR) repeat protein